jgi:pimeloyl-ACP methyl ester carboxylesterase
MVNSPIKKTCHGILLLEFGEYMNWIKITLAGLAFNCMPMIATAIMPKVICNSVCSDTPNTYKSNQSISSDAHCTHVGEYQTYYRLAGHGSPTIIFSSGTGFPADGWFESGIASAMAKKVRVFAYDRIFTFNSCPSPNNYMPNTAQDVVNHLHQLLVQEKIKPPYILVGHSFGGLDMLLYAREYPNEVAGLLLMDATTSDGPTPLPKPAEKILRHLGNPQNPIPDDPLYNELIGQLPSYLQIQQAPPLPKNMPLIVIYATQHCLPQAWTKKLFCMSREQEATHAQGQLAIYNMSNNHQLIRVDGMHASFFDKEKTPTVVKALNTLLEMSK